MKQISKFNIIYWYIKLVKVSSEIISKNLNIKQIIKMQVGLNIHMYRCICIKEIKNKTKIQRKTFKSSRVSAVVVFVCLHVSVRTSRRREVRKVCTLTQTLHSPTWRILTKYKVKQQKQSMKTHCYQVLT